MLGHRGKVKKQPFSVKSWKIQYLNSEASCWLVCQGEERLRRGSVFVTLIRPDLIKEKCLSVGGTEVVVSCLIGCHGDCHDLIGCQQSWHDRGWDLATASTILSGRPPSHACQPTTMITYKYRMKETVIKTSI